MTTTTCQYSRYQAFNKKIKYNIIFKIYDKHIEYMVFITLGVKAEVNKVN